MNTFPDQTILHNEGNIGNCMQATIAGILGWKLDDVPHFTLLGEYHWWICFVAWLEHHDMTVTMTPDPLAGYEVLPYCYLSGASPRGNGLYHAVVGDTKTSEMIHDPHPSRDGVTKVEYQYYIQRKKFT